MVVAQELSYNLAGTVVNIGLPINGTRIRLFDYRIADGGLARHFLKEEVTGPKGDFSFDVNQGLYAIEVVPADNTRFARQSFEPIRVTSNTDLRIVLKSGSLLSGAVLDAEGKTIPSCQIDVFGFEPQVVRASQETDESGNYSLSLANGKYYVNVKHPTFLCSDFSVVELDGDLNHNLVLPRLVEYQGIVVDEAKQPVPGVTVSISSLQRPRNIFTKEWARSLECLTDADGKFSCFVQSGKYGISLKPAGTALGQRQIGPLTIEESCSAIHTLESGHRFSGRITFADSPVANALITICGAELESSWLTDSSGSYSFSLPEGIYEYSITVQPNSPESLPQKSMAPLLGELCLVEDTTLDIELVEGNLVRGRILDPTQKPRSGVELSLFATKNKVFNGTGIRSIPLLLGLTDENGNYELRLMPDAYWLVINNQSSTGRLIDIGNLEEQNLVIADICVVSFEVVSEDEAPVPGCHVTFEAYGLACGQPGNEHLMAELSFPAMTDESGRCNLTLSAGIYSFCIQPPERSCYAPKTIRQLSVMGDISRRLRLSLKEGK